MNIPDELVEEIVDRATIERLRQAGFLIVPIAATEEMLKVGAPCCYIVPDGDWETALRDAKECWQAMTEMGAV